LSFTTCRKHIAGDIGCIYRVYKFLGKHRIINWKVNSSKWPTPCIPNAKYKKLKRKYTIVENIYNKESTNEFSVNKILLKYAKIKNIETTENWEQITSNHLFTDIREMSKKLENSTNSKIRNLLNDYINKKIQILEEKFK